jgi:hypothetical protein
VFNNDCITLIVCISHSEYVENSDLHIDNNEEINSWDILVDRGVYISPIALVITKSIFLICVICPQQFFMSYC